MKSICQKCELIMDSKAKKPLEPKQYPIQQGKNISLCPGCAEKFDLVLKQVNLDFQAATREAVKDFFGEDLMAPVPQKGGPPNA